MEPWRGMGCGWQKGAKREGECELRRVECGVIAWIEGIDERERRWHGIAWHGTCMQLVKRALDSCLLEEVEMVVVVVLSRG